MAQVGNDSHSHYKRAAKRPFSPTIMHTRSAAKKVESGQVHNDDGMVIKDTHIDHRGENRAPSMAKKQRRDGTTAAPKKRRRGKPAEICQLNLDVLFLVRDFFVCFSFADGRDGDRLPHTSTLQTSSTLHAHANLFDSS